MQFIQRHGTWVVILVALFITVWYFFGHNNQTPSITTIADIGTVTTFVSVSGTAEVDDIIPLSFPRGGTVSGIFVARGDTVATSTILATIGDATLQAEYAAVLAEVTRTRAIRDELLAGQTKDEARVTATTIANAEDALTNTIRTEAARVEAARVTLYSTGLTAIAKNPDTEAPPPVVSGSYTCTAEGTYTIEPYRSGTYSGYSYRYTGIETGTGNASTNQPSDLGNCGLRLQFTPDISYNNTTFTITIPNTQSSLYATNRALYDQARAQEEANIAASKRTLALALDQATVATAGARVERLIAANAAVTSAEARLTQATIALSDSALRAPRSGIITDSTIVVGQTVSTAPVFTLFAPQQTTISARIPEKDVTKVIKGQKAYLVFDAQLNETLVGTVTFISPLQTIINGTPYYEALIELPETPLWIRSGMQADIRIIITELTDVVRIPRLFLIENNVLIRHGASIATTTPEILLIGTDGFVAVAGIEAGKELVIPQ
jgi:multidrug efflux pump subunit AcrA (membrane-fusion protein)